MKIKQTLSLIGLLVITFITGQSFYYLITHKVPVKRELVSIFPTGHVSFCAPPFIEFSAANDIPALKGWGNYAFKITTSSDSAQYFFNQGLSLYYAFHMIEAYASFSKANKLDTTCAMAWYGKALAMGPTINYGNDYKPRSSAVQAAIRGGLLAQNCTPLEKDLIGAMQQRYSNDTSITVTQLRVKYADAMQKVYEKHPDNPDVLTLYADALLLLHPWDLYTHDFKPKPWTPLIQTLLEKAIAISPKHPGANHYYIHTVEASGNPGKALKSAGLLDTLMPSVAHITHMPSHIYIRTGNYTQGLISNDAAVKGYKSYLNSYKSTVFAQGLYEAHNVHMKINCAQMAGDYKDAYESSATLQSQVPLQYLGLKNADGNYYQYIYMQPTLTAVRFGKWDDVLKIKLVDSLAYASVLQRFSRGIAYCGKGSVALAKVELSKLEAKIQDKALKASMDNFSSSYETSCVARLILQGVISAKENKFDAAIAYLQKAVVAEDHIIYNEPRDWPLPTRQFLSDVLIKAGKFNQAVQVLNKDLFINPNNGWSLTGLKQVYTSTNNTIQLNELKPRLASAWKIKDVPIERPVF